MQERFRYGKELEVQKEGDIAGELARGVEDRLAGVDANLCEPARLQELVCGEARSGCLQSETREGVEDDLGEAVEIADQEREEPDAEGLLY
jgi:hypothetical protein